MGITGGIYFNTNLFSSRLEELLWVVVFLENILLLVIIPLKLFLMVLHLLHPVAREAAV